MTQKVPQKSQMGNKMIFSRQNIYIFNMKLLFLAQELHKRQKKSDLVFNPNLCTLCYSTKRHGKLLFSFF